MSTPESLGDLINSLGVTHDPEPGELVSDAIVILKTIDEDGEVGLVVRFSENSSWLERLGMLRMAEQCERTSVFQDETDD